eukprot:TRINITY_DN16655_c0_g1_i2.p1 TRINITY_DN16655_c0_g1~~TRINITY_DN16655_c0_g1_i2.p1  ORF type:complete len:261 (+),score=44.78 TRINITY_DN16655_c0_g1_i2:123-905(+)
MQRGLVGSEMCIRDRYQRRVHGMRNQRQEVNFNMNMGQFGQTPVYDYREHPEPEPEEHSPVFQGQNERHSDIKAEMMMEDLNEPPLLEELGIDAIAIKNRLIEVCKMTMRLDSRLFEDTDLTGPLIIVIAFGIFLMLNGKLHFGYIYGIGIFGSLGIWALINLISTDNSFDLYSTTSILGYCLLPIAIISILPLAFRGVSIWAFFACPVAILWSTHSATTIIELTASLKEQKWLLAYPIALFYASFVLIAIFQSICFQTL